MEKLFFFAIGVLLCYGVACLGRKRKIGFGWAFFISLLNLPLGLIITLCSKKLKNDVEFIDMKKEEA